MNIILDKEDKKENKKKKLKSKFKNFNKVSENEISKNEGDQLNNEINNFEK